MSAANVSKKRKQVCQAVEVDRISELPLHLAEQILDRLPLENAVRMGILSRHWRNKWCQLSQLILDQEFIDVVIKWMIFSRGTSYGLLEYSSIVDSILFRHAGPINKFVLYIPHWFREDLDISHWIQFVSTAGLKDLTLHQAYSRDSFSKRKVPCCLFSSVGFSLLTHLSLLNCSILSLPTTFGGFPCLVSLLLHSYHIHGSMEATDIRKLEILIAKCSKLESLSLIIYSECKSSISIYAPKLQHLIVGGNLSEISLDRTTMITWLFLDTQWNHRQDVFGFFLFLPELQDLHLGDIFWLSVMFLGEDGPVEKLYFREFSQLKSLRLDKVCLDRHMIMSFVLCLLLNSPHLEDLSVDAIRGFPYDDNACDNMLREEDCSLRSLKTVTISFPMSLGVVVLCLIKFLLACSPVLQVMEIHLIHGKKPVGAEEKLNVVKELIQYRRVSSNVDVTFMEGY